MFFIESAYAAGPAPAAGNGGMMTMLIYLIGFAAIFYFLIWRPQNKRIKEHRALMDSIQVGDEVVINGGVLGRVTKTQEEYAIIEVANGVELKVQKHAVTTTLPKGTIKNI